VKDIAEAIPELPLIIEFNNNCLFVKLFSSGEVLSGFLIDMKAISISY